MSTRLILQLGLEMHLYTYLVAVAAAAATSASACTFAFDNVANLNAFDGGGLKCRIYIYDKDNANPGEDKSDASGEITCDVSGGCADLEYKGETYRFCHGGMSEAEITGEASVQRKGEGTVSVNIVPDGESDGVENANPVGQLQSYSYWRGNIGCP